MNRIDRLFGISTYLQSRKYATAEKIAMQFDISIRTVYRDIRALTEQGIPIGFEPHKGYFIISGYFLPPVSFTMEEANALQLTEKLASGFADRSISNHYTNALNKLRAVLKPAQQEQLEQLQQKMGFQIPKRLVPDFEYLSTLQQAIAGKKIVQITYKSLKDEESCRDIECIGLIYYAFSWHVIAWCHLRNDYRDFNVLRILSIRETGNPFVLQSHISIADYMKQLPVDY